MASGDSDEAILVARPARHFTGTQLLRTAGLSFLVAVACVVLVLQGQRGSDLDGQGSPVVILDEEASDEGGEKPLDVKELKREIAELEKQEMSHAQARQKALESAIEKTSSLNCTSEDDGCKHAAKAIRWKASKDKYEQAALKDILKEWKKEHNVTAEGLKEFHAIQLKAQKLSGIKELNDLQKSAAAQELARNRQQEATLKALKKETKELNHVKLKEKEAREARDQEKQSQANAKLRSEKEQNLHAMSYRPADRARAEARAETRVQHQDKEFRARERHSASASEEDKIVSAAKSEDEEREAAFHREVAAMRKKDAAARQQHEQLLKDLAKTSKEVTAEKERNLNAGQPVAPGQGPQDASEAEHRADVRQAEKEEEARQGAAEKERAAALAKHAAAAADKQREAARQTKTALDTAARAEGWGAEGTKKSAHGAEGTGEGGGFGHVGEYRADVAAAGAAEAAREEREEGQEKAAREAEERTATQRQATANAEAERALAAENAAAGYATLIQGQSRPAPSPQSQAGKATAANEALSRAEAAGAESPSADDRSAVQKVPPSRAGAGHSEAGSELQASDTTVETHGAGEAAQLALTDKVIANREAEMDEIFGP